jgi:Flp pilus assembly protein TadG
MERSRREGFVLLTIALSAFALFGACGLAVDVGRMYIAKNELQTFTDSASLSAALRLNGESSGIERARAEVDAMRAANRWLLGSSTLSASGVNVSFGQWSATAGAPTNWTPSNTGPASPADFAFTRVIASTEVPVYFLPVVTGRITGMVAASSIAGQMPSSTPQGLFPFTPMAHDRTRPHFGLAPGQQYTLKWSSAPKLTGHNVCAGDGAQKWIDLANSRGADNRGYYGDQANAALIWDQVANDAPVGAFQVGDFIILTGGAKSTVKDALETRILQDGDPYTDAFETYRDRGARRRLITVPITDPTNSNEVVGFGRFFLLRPENYQTAQGNDPWCAEYVGPASPEGSDSNGASQGNGMITKVRLWE